VETRLAHTVSLPAAAAKALLQPCCSSDARLAQHWEAWAQAPPLVPLPLPVTFVAPLRVHVAQSWALDPAGHSVTVPSEPTVKLSLLVPEGGWIVPHAAVTVSVSPSASIETLQTPSARVRVAVTVLESAPVPTVQV
jgi:hypothetical protein